MLKINDYDLKTNSANSLTSIFALLFAFNISAQKKLDSIRNDSTQIRNASLSVKMKDIEQIVITGTRTPKRKTNSAVIVNLINSKTLDQVVATTLSEGLKYQPGLRVETDCQTCN